MAVDSGSGTKIKSLLNKKTGQEHIWTEDNIGLPDVLFPHCGKYDNDEYIFEGTIYPMPQHGFLRFREMTCIAQTKTSVVHSLKSDDSTKKMYPFSFQFDVKHQLLEDHVEMIYKVTNTGEDDMYYSVGCHLGYASPIDRSCDLSDGYIEFDYPETADTYVLDQEKISDRQVSFLNGEKDKSLNGLFEKGAIVLDLSKMKSRAVTIRNKRSPYVTRVEFPDAKNLVIWATAGDARFVCVEPWQGMFQETDHDGDLKTKRDTIVLSSGATKTMTQKIYLS